MLRIRHFLYDNSILTSNQTPVYSIGLGNIEVGGSGKTPHAIFFIQHLLQEDNKLSLISRGYGRESKAPLELKEVNPKQYGDEPSLIWKASQQLAQVIVAKKRVDGFQFIQDSCDFLLFDDILQHRAIQADCYIAISRFQKPFTSNQLFPIGTCRDIRKSIKRCDFLIISYSPKGLNSKEKYIQQHQLNRYFSDHQILFSSMEISWPTEIQSFTELKVNKQGVYLVSGIAHPSQFEEDVQSLGIQVLKHYQYPDHYAFNLSDIKNLLSFLKDENGVAILTSKDAIKWEQFLKQIPKQEWENRIYVCNQKVIPLFPKDWEQLFHTINKSK